MLDQPQKRIIGKHSKFSDEREEEKNKMKNRGWSKAEYYLEGGTSSGISQCHYWVKWQ